MVSDAYNIQKLAAFTGKDQGGNPAGVVLLDKFPADQDMLSIAADVGFSETVFAVNECNNHWRIRYFSPEQEVDFCGHATIALGAALGQKFGANKYELTLNNAQITVIANEDGSATLASPQTSSNSLDQHIETQVMSAFGLEQCDIDPVYGTRMVNAGNNHILIFIKDRQRLAQMRYDYAAMRTLMKDHNIVTIVLANKGEGNIIHMRNAFAFGGVVEDPATGASAAAVAGYLREYNLIKFKDGFSEIVFHQGDDMGAPSRIYARVPHEHERGVNLTGYVRPI